MSPFDDPVILAQAAAILRTALARPEVSRSAAPLGGRDAGPTSPLLREPGNSSAHAADPESSPRDRTALPNPA